MSAAGRALEGTNKIRVYADGISTRVTRLYRRFEPKSSVVGTKNKDQKFPFDDAECEIINVSKRGTGKTIKCANGDSILTGHQIDPKKIGASRTLKGLAKSKIDYLNNIEESAAKKGIKLWIVLEPTFETEYKYDISEIGEQIHATVIDNTALYRTNTKIWFDAGHLNYRGKKMYSRHLLTQLIAKTN